MTTQHRAGAEKRSLLKTLLLAVFAGVILGVFDLWAFEPSMSLFLAGAAAGVIFAVIFGVVIYFFGLQRGISLIFLTGASGGAAGFVWWYVAKSAVQPGIAIFIGMLLAEIAMWAEGGFKSEVA